ncbi:MAG: glycosyltransferase family 4 protein [Acidimicrobiales bacterium]
MGGAQTQLLGLVRAAAEDGFWEPSVLAMAPGEFEGDFRRLGIPVTVLRRRGSPGLGRLFKLNRTISNGHFDLVNSHLWHANAYSRLAVLGRRRPPYVVIVEHNLEVHRQAWRRLVDRPLASRADGCVAVTGAMAAFLLRMHPFDSASLTHIPYAIDRSVFHPESPQSSRISRVGGLGRLVPEKGWNVLLDAVRRLGDEGVDLEVEIGGVGPLREQLESDADGLPVRFVGMIPAGSAVADWLRTLDAFVLPSLHREARPVVVLEALATGLPVVATEIPGMAETLGGGGVAVPPGDDEALAAAIVRVLDDSTERNRSLEAASAIPDFKELARRYADLFTRTVQSGDR